MIAWSIAAAQESGEFGRIIVSTDDDEIADIAREFGAEVPFLRPAALSDDHATTVEVMGHAARWLEREHQADETPGAVGVGVSALCCIYATAPFMCADDLTAAGAAFSSGAWHYVFSATEYAAPIFRSFRVREQGGVEMFYPDQFNTRSQDLPQAFHDAAQFYWAAPATWETGEPIFGLQSLAHVIPRWRVQDIDTAEDWRRAELMAAALRASP